MMKERLNLKSIKNVLSRDELKKIMAGSTGGGGGTGGSGGCQNMGLAIPCCQCYNANGYVCMTNTPPIPYECSCYCQSYGYTGGLNDCPDNC